MLSREEFQEEHYEAVVEEPLGPTAGKRISLPWSFASIADLNLQLWKFANRYNTQRRESLEGEDSWKLYTPRERLWVAYQNMEDIIQLSRSRFDKWTTLSGHAKLRRRWYRS